MVEVQPYRPRSLPARAAQLLSGSAQAAGHVALERQTGDRLRRLWAVAADAARERRRPRRPRMRSLVLTSAGTFTWRDTAAPPAPGPLAAVVAPLAVATCDLDRPVALGVTPFVTPLHVGHECVAEVLSVGDQVHTVRPGDRVAVPYQISCGVCDACRTGLTGNCRAVPPLSMYGFGVAGGAWGGVAAEQVAVPYADAMLVPIPPGVEPASVASVSDTLSDAYRHVVPHLDRLRRHPEGPSVILLGSVSARTPFSGSVPLYAGQILRALAPEADVVVADARPWVRAQATGLGLDSCSPSRLRGRRAPLVVDCSADPAGLRLALRSTAPDGVCSCAGSLHASVRIPATLMFGRNVTLTVARSHARTLIPDVLDLAASGRLHPGRVTTNLASFDDAPEALEKHLRSADTKTVLVRDR